MMFDDAVDKLSNHSDVIDSLESQLEKIGDMVKRMMEMLRPK